MARTAQISKELTVHYFRHDGQSMWKMSSGVNTLKALSNRRQFNYSALRKYSAPLNFATFCHISGFKHKDIKLYFFVKNQPQVGHNHEVERHLLDISNFFNKSKTDKLGVQNYSAPLLSVQQTLSRSSVRISE